MAGLRRRVHHGQKCRQHLLLGTDLPGFAGEAPVYFLEDVCGANVQRIAQTIDHAQTGAVFPQLDEGDVVAVHGSAKSQFGLAPLSLCS